MDGKGKLIARGVSEAATTGVFKLEEMVTEGELLFSISVNECVTGSKFDNVFGCRHLLLDVPPPWARQTYWEVGRVVSCKILLLNFYVNNCSNEEMKIMKN